VLVVSIAAYVSSPRVASIIRIIIPSSLDGRLDGASLHEQGDISSAVNLLFINHSLVLINRRPTLIVSVAKYQCIGAA